MDKKGKQSFLLVAFGVTLYAALMNLGTVVQFFKGVCDLILPVLIGFVLAFMLNVPMRGFEKRLPKLFKKSKKQPSERAIRALSLTLTLIVVVLVLALLGTLLVPQLVRSVESLYNLVLKKWPEWAQMLQEHNINTEKISEWINSLNLGQLLNNLSNSAGNLIFTVVNFATNAVSSVSSFFISLIIAIYALSGKATLSKQVHKLVRAHLKKSVGDYLYHAANLLSVSYSKFLSGQCVEACILGTLIAIAYSIFGIPYALLIGVMTAVSAFIPYVGAFAACGLGAFLVLLVNPSQVLLCVVVYIVVQFIETQFIYPHVVGTSVGLSALWTLIAVMVGGSLFGLVGMIFFIPLTTVIIMLLREYTESKLAKKNAKTADALPTEDNTADPEEP